MDEAVSELRHLLTQIFHSLRRGVPESPELEPLKQAFHDAGLAGRHVRLLLTLVRTGPLSIGELAERMDLASATTSLLAGELERAGFLARREDERDRRRTIVSLPEHLKGPLAEVANAAAEPLRRTVEQLDPHDRERFLAALRLLATEAAQAETSDGADISRDTTL